MTDKTENKAAWYYHTWPLFIFAVLFFTVCVGFSVLFLAMKNPPGLVVDNYYDVGKGINKSLERENLARDKQITADLTFSDNQVQVILKGDTNFSQVRLIMQHPTKPEQDLILDLKQAEVDNPQIHTFTQSIDKLDGRRFVDILGTDNNQTWRLSGEVDLDLTRKIHLNFMN